MVNLANKKIGILVDYLGEYQYRFLYPMQQLLSDLQIHMMTFVGFELNHPREDLRPAGQLYDLVTQHSLDGLIVFGMISNHVSDQYFEKFLKSKNLPVVVIGRSVEGHVSVTSNQHTGMQELMRHLCDDCKYKNFAFIRGWQENFDSQLRESVFCEELHKRELNTHESMRVTGGFQTEKAGEVTKQLIDLGKPIDVIVAANDAMAIGAIQALTQLNIRVPQDIAVVGFDDIEASMLMLPALTTVRQPIYEMAEASVALIVNELLAKANKNVELPSQLVIRASSRLNNQSASYESDIQLPQAIRVTFEKFVQSELNVEALLIVWQHEIKQWALNNDNYDLCFSWLDNLLEYSKMSEFSQAKITETHSFIKQARMSIVSLIKYRDYVYIANHRQNYMNLMDAGLAMWAQTDILNLMRYIEGQLPKRKIKQCYIVLQRKYLMPKEQFELSTNVSESELVLSYHEDGSILQEGLRLGSTELITEKIELVEKDCHFVILPLFTTEDYFGYMMIESMDFGRVSGNEVEFEINYSSLRRDISNAIQITLHHQETLNYTSSLEKLVDKRTHELKLEISKHKKTEAELRIANTQLAEKALQDGLTGINNRYSFDQYLEKQWLEHQQQAKPISLILCDIDHFKLYNDSYGHLEGDDCLKQVADVLASQGNYPHDFVARYGGEEFAIILPDTKEQGACDVAEKVRNTLALKALPHKASPTSEHVTVSMGICTLIPDDGMALELLILKADQALYQAKNRGRNNFYLDNKSYNNNISLINYN